MLETVEQSKYWSSPFLPYSYEPEKCRELTKQIVEFMDNTQKTEFMNDTILSFHKVFHIDKWIDAEEEIIEKSGTVFDDIQLPDTYKEVFNYKQDKPINPIREVNELKVIFYQSENKCNPIAILSTDIESAFIAFGNIRERVAMRMIETGGDPGILDDVIWCLWDDINLKLMN